jgi:hypothetical protein
MSEPGGKIGVISIVPDKTEFEKGLSDITHSAEATTSGLEALINSKMAEANVQIDETKIKTDIAVQETRLSLDDVETEAKVRLNSIFRLVNIGRSTVMQFAQAAGITLDATLNAAIQTGFATVQLIFSLKAAAKIEGPTGWVRVPFLIASWAMSVAATIRTMIERQKIRTELDRNTRQHATIKRTVRI